MRLQITQLDSNKYVVYFNGKPLRHFIEADTDQGWVDIVDIQAMAPLFGDDNPFAEEKEPQEYEAIQCKRLHGEVEIRKLS